jgi:hypothetical protein
MSNLTTKRVTACAPAAYWRTTWGAFPEHSLVKILATQGCQLSQEGCFVIDRTSKYFQMLPETHMHILAHAMLLWNEFVKRDSSSRTLAHTGDTDEHDVVGLVLLAIACFQIAAKQCGGENCVRVHSKHCVTIAHNIVGRVYDTDATLHTDTPDQLLSAQSRLLEAECRVLEVLEWNTLMLRRMEKAMLRMQQAKRLYATPEQGKHPLHMHICLLRRHSMHQPAAVARLALVAPVALVARVAVLQSQPPQAWRCPLSLGHAPAPPQMSMPRRRQEARVALQQRRLCHCRAQAVAHRPVLLCD